MFLQKKPINLYHFCHSNEDNVLSGQIVNRFILQKSMTKVTCLQAVFLFEMNHFIAVIVYFINNQNYKTLYGSEVCLVWQD